MINWNGKRRWVALILLIAGILVMLTVPPIIPVIQLPGEKYPGGGDGFHMTNSLMGSVLVWILLILLAFYINRKMPKSGDEVPSGGFYNLFEVLFEGLYGFILNIVGQKYMRFIFSFFMTILLLVVLSNWLELVPVVDSVGFLEPHITRDATTGAITYEAGYETTNSGGIYVLNPKCPWVSPTDAAALTDAAKADRASKGCQTGTNAVVAPPAVEHPRPRPRVRRRAHHRAFDRHGPLLIGHLFGNSEIKQPDRPILLHENVGWFQVAMNNGVSVCELRCFAD